MLRKLYRLLQLPDRRLLPGLCSYLDWCDYYLLGLESHFRRLQLLFQSFLDALSLVV